MMIIKFTMQQLRAMPRPANYVDELRACAVEITGEYMAFDITSGCYQALKSKYSNYTPTVDDVARVMPYDKPSYVGGLSRSQLVGSHQGMGSVHSPDTSGCGGCRGRKNVQ